jgi:ABC-type nitrate/sulfonate/bicarbonate transport system substrate-binding protein
MIRIGLVAGAVIVALGAGSAAAQAPATVSAAIGANMNHVPCFVGVEKGIYLKHGVDVKLKLLNTGQEMSKALQAGEVQAVGAAFSNYPLAVERGMAAKGVVGQTGDRSVLHSDDAVSVWARKGSGITRIEDLAGRRVGTPVGGTADEYLGVVLTKKGLSRDKVTILNVPPGNLVSALQGASVDAVAAWEPFGSLVEARVPDAVLVSRGGGHIGYYINISFRNDLIEKDPALVEKFVIGHAEAAQWTRRHPDEAAEIATRWIPGLDLPVARQAIRHLVFDTRITKYTLEAWDENVRVLLEQKKLRAPLRWQQGMDLRFIDKVMRSHPELFSDLKPVP